jgi:hypothetical protein
VREPLREFLPLVPRLVGWWILTAVPTVFLWALFLGQRSLLESLQITVVLIPFGIPVLGFLWIHPLSRYTTRSVRRFLFACLWFGVTMFPAIGLMKAVDALVGSQLPIFRDAPTP